MHNAFDEVVDFIVVNNPRGVIAFRSSTKAIARVADLISREKTGDLSADERSELDHCLLVEELMRLAKARARRHLSRD
jgi:hypothetical protein